MNNIQLSKQFYNQLINLINNSQLSIDTAYYIMKSVTAELQLTYEQACCQNEVKENNDIIIQTEEAEPETIMFDIPLDNIENNIDIQEKKEN